MIVQLLTLLCAPIVISMEKIISNNNNPYENNEDDYQNGGLAEIYANSLNKHAKKHVKSYKHHGRQYVQKSSDRRRLTSLTEAVEKLGIRYRSEEQRRSELEKQEKIPSAYRLVNDDEKRKNDMIMNKYLNCRIIEGKTHNEALKSILSSKAEKPTTLLYTYISLYDTPTLNTFNELEQSVENGIRNAKTKYINENKNHTNSHSIISRISKYNEHNTKSLLREAFEKYGNNPNNIGKYVEKKYYDSLNNHYKSATSSSRSRSRASRNEFAEKFKNNQLNSIMKNTFPYIKTRTKSAVQRMDIRYNHPYK